MTRQTIFRLDEQADVWRGGRGGLDGGVSWPQIVALDGPDLLRFETQELMTRRTSRK